jgi:hypothetical protein
MPNQNNNITTIFYMSTVTLENMPWPGPRMWSGSNRALRSANLIHFEPKCLCQSTGEGWCARYCLAPMWGPVEVRAMVWCLWRILLRHSSLQSIGLTERSTPTTYIIRSVPDSIACGSATDAFAFHLKVNGM